MDYLRNRLMQLPGMINISLSYSILAGNNGLLTGLTYSIFEKISQLNKIIGIFEKISQNVDRIFDS